MVTLPIAVVHQVRDGRIAADWEIADTGPLTRRLTAAAVAATPEGATARKSSPER
jgi:hypothetical protein